MKFNKFKAWAISEEGKAKLKEMAQDLSNKLAIEASQLERFKDYSNIPEIIEKVIQKYESDSYKDRWYNRGIMPPEDLKFFLYDYAYEYGRECTDLEWEKYTNQFTSGLYFAHGYFFMRMDSQGSVIQIFKK